MSRKKKTVAADIKRRLIDDDRDISPFASIKLVEKKEEKPKPAVKPVRKKPSEIVQGYDPSSSFADILYSYEHTGNPYSMPKPTGGRAASGRIRDFGAILDKWEGKAPPKAVKKASASAPKKSSYTPSKSFGDILDSFEGKAPRKAMKEETVPAASADAGKETPLSENLFRKAEEGDAVSASASWSIFGGRNESFVRKADAPAGTPPEKPRGSERKKASYHPTRSFASILESYEGKAPEKAQKEEPSSVSPAAGKKEAAHEKPLSESLFRKAGEDDEVSASASWSIFGGRNEKFVRKEEMPQDDGGDAPSESPSSSYVPQSSFGSILDRYSRTAEKVKTFDDYLREKGDAENKKKETLTLSRLRTMPPQSTLDLHGYTVKEAEDAVRSFLSDCHENGIRKISIITGKGLHSEDGVGVLRSAVQIVLDESGLVSEKASAPLSAGGAGALWIILKA